MARIMLSEADISSIDKCNKFINKITSENKSLSNKISSNKKKIKDSKKQSESTQLELNIQNANLNKIKSQLNDKEAELNALLLMIPDAETNPQYKDAYKKIKSEVSDLKSKKSSAQSTVNFLTRSISEDNNTIRTLTLKNIDYQSDIDANNKAITQLKNQKSQLTAKSGSKDDHEDWQKCPHFKKGEWNIVSIEKNIGCGGTRLELQRDHYAWSNGWNGNWGAVSKSVYDKIKSGSKGTKNGAKPAGSRYPSVSKCNDVKIAFRNSKNNWTIKNVTFYYIPELKKWVIQRTPDTGTLILKDKSPADDGSKKKKKKHKGSEPHTFGDEYVQPADTYKEDKITPQEFEDDTDNSDKDLPNGLNGHSVSTFIKKVYKDGKGPGFKHYSEEDEYTNSNKRGAGINSNKDFKHLVRSRGIWNLDIHKWTFQYNRMQWANPDYAIGSTREYLFFTKPDLHILNRKSGKLAKGLGNDPFWTEMVNKYRDVIQMLQYSAPRVEGGSSWMNKSSRYVKRKEFITLLTNAVSGALDLPSSSADTTETGSTIYGTTIQYRKGAWKSDEGYDFSLEFVDSPYLQVYHFFKMWEEYTKLKDIGAVSPPGSRNCNPYRVNKILHDQIGIFKFIVGEDMETIQYYAYLTGCFPKSVPRDSFNNVNPGMLSYSIDWHAQFVEDMNPLILVHFNNIMRKELSTNLNMATGKDGFGKKPGGIDTNKYEYIPIYNHKYGHINGGFRSYPVIGIVNDVNRPGRYKYVLRWYDKKN